MKIRSLLAVASVAAHCACYQSAANNSTAAAPMAPAAPGTAPAGFGAAPAPGAPATPAPAGTANPQLQQEMAAAVQALRPSLPIRQQTPQGELVISNIEARGSELVYTMQLPMDMTPAMFEQFRQALPRQACATPQARMLLQQGGVYTYNLTDTGGEQFTTSVTTC